ncbi:MAG: hypothetical protein V1493_06735 [Candidatus Diapherotrites archaeon]
MDKANIAFAFIFLMPAIIIAIAFLFIIPSAIAGIVPVPGITSTTHKCGDCTNAWSAECRTLYRIDSYSNGAKSVSPVMTAPQTDYTYCYNRQFVKINFKESYKCVGSTSYKSLDSKGLPSSFKWSYGMDWPTYCAYGCNARTQKCNPQPAQAAKPTPKPIVAQAKPPAKTCVPTNYLVCKNGDSYRKYIYRDCSQAEFLVTDCGSCQTCTGGKCIGKPSGSTTKPAVQTPAQATNSSTGTKRNNYRAAEAKPIITSNYGKLYSPSSKWVCDSTGHWKVPVDILGNWIWNSAKYCENGCSGGSCKQAAGTCTYNSECPSGYYCKRLESGNACRPRN